MGQALSTAVASISTLGYDQGVTGANDRKLYAMRPPGATRALRILGVIDLVGGLVVLLTGAAFIISDVAPGKGTPPPIYLGVILILLGLAVGWAGLMMGFAGVVVTSSKITTIAALPHSIGREDIDQISVVRSDFGRLERVLPVVVRKGSTDVKLVPLAWPYRGHFPGSGKAGLTLDYQATLVKEIRRKLGVGGDDYTSV